MTLVGRNSNYTTDSDYGMDFTNDDSAADESYCLVDNDYSDDYSES